MNIEELTSKYEEYRHALIWRDTLHKEPELSEAEALSIINKTQAWMLRNIYDFDTNEETNFWYIIKDHYDESEYSKKTRKYIKKANEKFDIRRISYNRMIAQGYDVYEKAHRNYKVNDGFQLNRNEFISEINNMNCDEYEFWGCIDRETDILQAYSISHIHDGMCWFKYSRANPEFLPKYYPMYGMYDARNKYYLGERNLMYVMTSARSITRHSEIQSFLIEKFNFRKAYCRLRIHYKPWLRLIVSMTFPIRNLIVYKPLKNLLHFEAINRGYE